MSSDNFRFLSKSRTMSRAGVHFFRASSAALLSLAACADSAPSPIQFAECTAEDSPTELLRIEDGMGSEHEFQVYDLGKAVSMKTQDGSLVFDNCGGDPVRIRRAFGLATGAANLGGEVVLCSGGAGHEPGVWELLEDGSAGSELGLGRQCLNSVTLPSYGFISDEDGIVQHQRDGTVRRVASGPSEIVGTAEGFATLDFGDPPMLHPADGPASIPLDLPGPFAVVARRPSPVSESPWMFVVPPYEGFNETLALGVSPVYAFDIRSGAWFQPPVEIELVGRVVQTISSVRDGLAAFQVEGFELGTVFSRSEWEEELARYEITATTTSLMVVDNERVFLVSEEDVRLIRVPLELPETGEAEFELLWSRRRSDPDAQLTPIAPWNGVVLVEQGETWAYPLDGGEPYAFLPAFQHAYYGAEYVTALGQDPQNPDEYWLGRNSIGGEFELIDERIISGTPEVFSMEGDPQTQVWTPDLGRVLYSVQDGDALSVRQHRIAD